MSIPKVRRRLLRTQRTLGDVDAVIHRNKARRRVKNRLLGKILGRAGFWHKLWR
jgi:hypothetical protein